MESSAPVSRYVARNSNKRVFSSSLYKDVEVLDIPSSPPPSTNRASKPNSSKQKEVLCQEIIDVDDEEYHIDRSSKGKKALSNSLVGLGSGSVIRKSKKATVNFNPNVLYSGKDEWINTYYDDIVFDDYSVLQSHFDDMDIPSGVEAPFPWLSDSHQDDKKAEYPTTSSSTKIGNQKGQIPKSLLHSKWLKSDPSLNSATSSTSSAGFLPVQNSGGSLHPGNESSSRRRRSRGNSSSHNQFPSVQYQSGYPSLSMSSSAPGLGMHMPNWSNMPLNMLKPPVSSSTLTSGFVPMVNDSPYNQTGVASANAEKRDVDKLLQKFTLFKKFDTVEDYSDHHFAKNGSSAHLGQKNWAKKIQEEWKILEKDLPDTIFVRVYESRMDLLRAVIVGAEGTPYHDGLFFFDVFFPRNYPDVPPKVHYHSGGLRINPNLYNCGKVCLSLLHTWHGHGQEKWLPGKSTMLQVLVSIQGLILNAKPYFNEPEYGKMGGTKYGEEKSLEYNERTYIYNLQTMVYSMRRPPKHFEAYVVGYYCKVARDVLLSCKAYLEGVQVGCLVKGGVQDVDEDDKKCSKNFRDSLAGYITTLVNAFTQIGAKDCQQFLSLAGPGPAPAPAPAPPRPITPFPAFFPPNAM